MYKIRKSNIHDYGIIATEDIPIGTRIGFYISNRSVKYLKGKGMIRPRYLKNGEWWEDYPLGRFCNHSKDPNTELKLDDGRYYLISKKINKGEEILVDYRWIKEITGYNDEFINKI